MLRAYGRGSRIEASIEQVDADSFLVRVDDARCPEFWAEIYIDKADLEAASRRFAEERRELWTRRRLEFFSDLAGG